MSLNEIEINNCLVKFLKASVCAFSLRGGKKQHLTYRMSFVTFNEVFKVLQRSTPELNLKKKKKSWGKYTACNTAYGQYALHEVEIYFGFVLMFVF